VTTPRRQTTKASTLFATATVTALVLALPGFAHACPVCFDPKEPNRIAFLVSTAFLSLLPLGLMGGVIYWLWKSAKAAEEAERQPVTDDAREPARARPEVAPSLPA